MTTYLNKVERSDDKMKLYSADINQAPTFVLVNEPCYVICACGDTNLVNSRNGEIISSSNAIAQPFIYRYDYNLYSTLATSGYSFIPFTSNTSDDGLREDAYQGTSKFQLDFIFGVGMQLNSVDRNDMPRFKMPEIGMNTGIFKLNPVNDRLNNIFNLAVINSRHTIYDDTNTSNTIKAATLATIAVVPIEPSDSFKCSILNPISNNSNPYSGQVFNHIYERIFDGTYWRIKFANIADEMSAEQYPDLKNKTLRSCSAATFVGRFTENIADHLANHAFEESPLHQFFRENFIEA